MAQKLHYHHVVGTSNAKKLIEKIACSVSNHKCMYRTCTECSTKLRISLQRLTLTQLWILEVEDPKGNMQWKES